jgi:hypothetical protein
MLKAISRMAVIAALLVMGTTVACGSGSSSEDKTASKGLPGQDDQALRTVQAALTNFATVKNFKVVMTAQVRQPNGMIGGASFTYDFVQPDRFQLYTGPTAGITRVVGNETFAYDRPTDKWTLLTDYSGSAYDGYNKLFESKRLNDIAKSMGETTTVVKGATETVEGKTCQVYVLTDQPTQNKTDMCIADNLPLRFIYHVGDLTTTAVFSNYNANIEIDRPKTN